MTFTDMPAALTEIVAMAPLGSHLVVDGNAAYAYVSGVCTSSDLRQMALKTIEEGGKRGIDNMPLTVFSDCFFDCQVDDGEAQVRVGDSVVTVRCLRRFVPVRAQYWTPALACISF